VLIGFSSALRQHWKRNILSRKFEFIGERPFGTYSASLLSDRFLLMFSST
jgi:hypothetical protein